MQCSTRALCQVWSRTWVGQAARGAAVRPEQGSQVGVARELAGPSGRAPTDLRRARKFLSSTGEQAPYEQGLLWSGRFPCAFASASLMY
jgi:hypothetical protein